MNIASPCTGICKLDADTGWCVGCGRSGDEIAVWGSASAMWRDGVWGEIPARLSQLGVTCRRLAWTTEDIQRFVIETLKAGQGTWVMGVVGAVAEFTPALGQEVSVTADGDDVIARTENGALRMRVNDDVRALTFDLPGMDAAPRVLLAVKRERGRLSVADGITDLGDDTGALINEPATRRFDLGLKRKEARFTVRLAAGAAQDALVSATGLAFVDGLPQIGAPLVDESPTRVVETALGRIEVQGQIPPPGARSPDGPHTHLLPDQLATGRALPVGLELPRAYLPGALYYPPP